MSSSFWPSLYPRWPRLRRVATDFCIGDCREVLGNYDIQGTYAILRSSGLCWLVLLLVVVACLLPDVLYLVWHTYSSRKQVLRRTREKKENNEPRWMERIWVVGSPAEDPLAQAEAHRSVPRNENALFGLAGLRGRSESRRRGHALLNRSPSLFVQKQALSDFGRSQQIWPRPHYAQYTKMSDSITVRYSSLLLLVVGILETVMDRWFGYCKPSVAMETKQCTSTVSVSLFAPAP